VREIYDVPHPAPWGWKVWSYLWTKSIAAGALLAAAVLGLVRPEFSDHPLVTRAAPAVALLFMAATALLLIFDLRRPERFWYMLVRPNWLSWLVRGSVVLAAFGAVAAWWLAAPGRAVYAISIPTALAAAGYTAFLFRQAKGREFWGSKWVLVHLLVQALVAGAASMAILAPMSFFDGGARALLFFGPLLGASLCAHALFARLEARAGHGSPHARRAAREISDGAHRRDFLGNVLGAGLLAPLGLLAALPAAIDVAPSLSLVASLLALWGLYRYERMWILAGQSVPLS
jgi:formate-dependent nitrite reductase membrane component NrfD